MGKKVYRSLNGYQINKQAIKGWQTCGHKDVGWHAVEPYSS